MRYKPMKVAASSLLVAFAMYCNLAPSNFLAVQPVCRTSFHTWRCATRMRWYSTPLKMASTSDFKTGLTIELNDIPFKILEFLHVKPGKGGAFVRSKLKNMITGSTQEKTFRAGENVQLADIEKVELIYSNKDGIYYKFLDANTFDEVVIPEAIIGNRGEFLADGETVVNAIQHNGKFVDIILPKVLTIEVEKCDPPSTAAKGNSRQGANKPAVMVSGATIMVPLFIQEGDKIRIDSDAKKYTGKAND